MLKSVFSLKFRMYDLILVGIVCGAFTVNTFLYCICAARGLLDPNNKGVDIFDQVFIVTLVDFSVTDNLKNCVYKVYCFFFLYSLNC